MHLPPSSYRRRALLLLAAGALAITSARAQTTTTTGNLLTNPGAEQGTGTDPGTVTGWTAAGTSNPGRDNGSFDPEVGVYDGAYDFYGNIGAGGTLTQRVNLFSAGVTAAQINAGSATAAFSFFEQSEPGQADSAGVNLLFLNAAGTQIGTATSGEISQDGSWVQTTSTAAIPAGTQYVDYQLFFNRHTGNDVDSFLDDVSLTVNVVPEPSAWAAVLAGAGFLVFTARRRAHR